MSPEVEYPARPVQGPTSKNEAGSLVKAPETRIIRVPALGLDSKEKGLSAKGLKPIKTKILGQPTPPIALARVDSQDWF